MNKGKGLEGCLLTRMIISTIGHYPPSCMMDALHPVLVQACVR